MSNEGTIRKLIWVPCDKELYKPAYVVTETNMTTEAQSDVRKTYKNTEIYKMNPTKFDKIDDLAALSHLNEPSVLHNIKTRYENSLIYTYSGLFLIAVNPYHDMNIYGDDVKHRISKLKGREGQPHIYVVANEAYKAMIRHRKNQSILITGESGAGKTENTKKVCEYLAYISKREMESVNKELMSANLLLEAFGNAKTVKNDNSSRFGKFVQLKFKGDAMCGVKIEKYLLEKSRVTTLSEGERNFHVFYYLLAGMPEPLRLELGLEKTRYSCLGDTKIAGLDEKAEFEKLEDAFGKLEIHNPQKYYRTLAAILHLSNVRLTAEGDECKIENPKSIENVCRLLQLDHEEFARSLLTPIIKAGDENVRSKRSSAQVKAVLEGFMRTLYETMFDSLVAEINSILDSPYDTYIGILDIAGFEIFRKNSFEQLCINYTNERLQQFFNHHMFVLEQEIYKVESIEWNFIDFGLDLEPTIKAIDGQRPIGIFSYLDEECVMPCASNRTLYEKLCKVSMVESVPFKQGFKIKHYAGDVEYEIDDWLTKNRDVESEGLLKVKRNDSRSSHIMKGMFKTVVQSHRDSLNFLMKTLNGTQPHFVRCILPNLQKSSEVFDKRLVLSQLRCNGVLEGIRISRLGYPSRLPFAEFNQRYKILLEKEIGSGQDIVLERSKTECLAEQLGLNRGDYKVGNTLIFFRQGVLGDLEEQRDKHILKLSQAVQQLLSEILSKRREEVEKSRMDAVLKLQENAGHCLSLLRWRWWSLLQKITPLLEVKKAENDRKDLEMAVKNANTQLEAEKERKEALEKDLRDLQIAGDDLRGYIEKLEGLLREKEALVGDIQNENRQVNEALGDKEKSVGLLREKISEQEVLLGNHARTSERLNMKIASLEANLNDDTKRLKERIASLEHSNEENAGLVAERTKEIARIMAELSKLTIVYKEEAREKDELIEKMREEIKDQERNAEGMSSQLCQLDMAVNEKNAQLKNAQQELEYVKLMNEGLESSLARLKTIREAAQTEVKEKNESELSKRIKTLEKRLECEERMNARLLEEKDNLYNENLKLVQSKLDELFQTEQEYNAARSAMQNDIRKLEMENERLKRDSAGASDSSEDAGFEKMVALLESERGNRKKLDLRVIELENEINRLRHTKDNVVVDTDSVNEVKEELRYLQNCLKAMTSLFSDFYDMADARITETSRLLHEACVERSQLLSEKVGTQCLKERHEKLADEHQKLQTSFEAMKIEKSVAARTLQEVQEHSQKLESMYNEREEEIGKLRLSVEELAALEKAVLEELHEKIRKYSMRLRSSEQEARIREVFDEKIAALESENKKLRAELVDSGMETEKLRSEAEVLRGAIEAVGGLSKVAMPDGLVKERLVSTLVVDKDAFKAFEWKKIVAAKSVEVEKREDSEKMNLLMEEMNLTRLNLQRSEKAVEENKRVIDALRACVSVMRKKKK